MEKYKYKAIDASGRPISGMLSAASENDLMAQLQAAGFDLISCKALSQKTTKGWFGPKVTLRDLIQFFIHVDQMEGAGIPILDSLADVRDSTDNTALRDMMAEVYRDVSEGAHLSEALAKHAKVFNNLHISLIAAGEETGKMSEAYRQLIKYLKWTDDMQSRVRKATRYPMILLFVVVVAVGVMMGFVVPQIVGFIKNMEMELPFATVALIATSEFFQEYWWAVIVAPIILFSAIKFGKKYSVGFARKMDEFALKAPKFGGLIRKINLSRFCQTFGALFASGLPVMECLKTATNTVDNMVLYDALQEIQVMIKRGATFAEAFNSTGAFPSLVVRMLRVGQETGGLTVVLEQVSEFYTKDVDEEVQKLIAMIEPTLTMVLGGMILWIAVGVFGPIYSSFEHIKF